MENITQNSIMSQNNECMHNFQKNILYKILKSTLDKFDNILPHLYFSSIFLGKDYIDDVKYNEKDNPEDFDKVYCKYIKGAAMRFSYPYGTIQHHEKNSILFEFIGYKFIMKENIIPFSMMTNTFGNTDEERIEKAKVKVKRSNGKIQNALLDISHGFEIQKEKNRILVRVNFYPDENEGDEPIHYTITEHSKNNKSIKIKNTYPNQVLNKGVSLSDFLKVNPDFKFHVSVPSPIAEYKKIYDNYISGNTDMEDMYDCLNLYYKLELQKYFQMVHEIFSEDIKNAFQYDIYSHNSMLL